jgi:hypothetical protein
MIMMWRNVGSMMRKSFAAGPPSELSALSEYLNSADPPTPGSIPELLRTAGPDLATKLIELGNLEIAMTDNEAGAALRSSSRLSGREIQTLKDTFVDMLAKNIIQTLRNDRTMQVRLFARDMDEVYYRIVNILGETTNTPEGKTNAEVLARVQPVSLSRPLSRVINSTDAQEVLRVTDSDIRNSSKIVLLDVGYDGSIAQRVAPIINQTPLGRKAQWSLVWGSNRIPNFVTRWQLPEFQNYVRNYYPAFASDEAQASSQLRDRAFRVGAVEHQAKWTERIDAEAGQKTYIMLDLDDTVLKEVPVNRYKDHPMVQAIKYRPSTDTYNRYAERLKQPPSADKVIHYELSNGEMTGYVVVRPAIRELIQSVEALIKSGKVEILVTSSNDEARTRAMVDNLRIEGRTLSQLGARMIPKSNFGTGGGKDVSLLRRSLGISSSARVFAVDDIPDQFKGVGANDTILGVKAWNFDMIYDYLDNTPKGDAEAVKDALDIRGLADRIYNANFSRSPTGRRERLIYLAQMIRLAGGPQLAFAQQYFGPCQDIIRRFASVQNARRN